MIRKDLVSL
ncbi:UNVERIFIED_CONTAM: hypothetical protein GTU68_066476 [Idotea baltica]|nr:hypothetical protein [Idotea baltica]